jgi:hypothetical protein
LRKSEASALAEARGGGSAPLGLERAYLPSKDYRPITVKMQDLRSRLVVIVLAPSPLRRRPLLPARIGRRAGREPRPLRLRRPWPPGQ